MLFNTVKTDWSSVPCAHNLLIMVEWASSKELMLCYFIYRRRKLFVVNLHMSLMSLSERDLWPLRPLSKSPW